ncbi:hypothetical protein FKM82_027639 [Ascaphus truei]
MSQLTEGSSYPRQGGRTFRLLPSTPPDLGSGEQLPPRAERMCPGARSRLSREGREQWEEDKRRTGITPGGMGKTRVISSMRQNRARRGGRCLNRGRERGRG